MSIITMKSLLESGVHFGHQTHKWNPKMKKYIFIKRNGIHILDLKQTLDAVHETYMFIKDIVSKGESVLFVGTKKQAKESVENSAKKCGAFFISNRWYGGMLTNMQTIRKSIEKLEYYEQIVEDGTINSFTKLEAVKMHKVYDKVNNALGGIRGMDKLPGAVFIVDTIKEKIAVNEARKLNIPIVAMVDTNCDPDIIDYVIPANDDAIRAILLIADTLANAVIEGKQAYMEGADIVIPEHDEVVTEEKPEKIHKEKPKKREPEKVEDEKEIKKEEIEKPKKVSKQKVVKKKPDKESEKKEEIEKPKKELKPKVIEKKSEKEKESKPEVIEKKPEIEKPKKELKSKSEEKKSEKEKPKKESKLKVVEKKSDKEPEKTEEKQKEKIAKPKKKKTSDEKPKKEEKETTSKKATKKTTAKKTTPKKEKQEKVK